QAASRYEGLRIGDPVEVRRALLTVVGHFAAAGSAVESEIWIDRTVVHDVYRRAGGVGLVRARLTRGADPEQLARRIAEDPRLQLALVTEIEFFAEQSADRTALINTFAYFIAGIMGIGSVLAALNTMYIAVSRRTVEIATLRAVGFGAASVVVSVIFEAMLLAILGGVAGALLVYFALDGYATTTFNNASASQVAFAFKVTPELAAIGLVWALGLGLVGGLLPAIRAARLPITRALRGD
ncbi:MAG: ABC transporter permease, partial [Pseudomonadales bacterium]